MAFYTCPGCGRFFNSEDVPTEQDEEFLKTHPPTAEVDAAHQPYKACARCKEGKTK